MSVSSDVRLNGVFWKNPIDDSISSIFGEQNKVPTTHISWMWTFQPIHDVSQMDVRRLECGQPRILQASVRQWSVRVACISRHRSFQSLEGFEDSCAYWHIVVLFILTYGILWCELTPLGHLYLNSARSARPSERRDSNDAKGNDTGEGPRGLVELDHPRLPGRSQRYNAELRQIMTFSDAFKAFKTLPLNAPLWPCGPQCSKIWLLSGVKLRKSPKMHLLRAFFVPTETVSFGRWWKRWKLSHLKMTPPSDFIQWNR